jgi:acetylornithine/succinyldiaminopimelate/putrescine aminotransferase
LNSEKLPQLSRLESTVHYARGARLISAHNDTVTIESTSGERRELIDLMSSYAAVNFGHCNPHIRPFDRYEAHLVSFFTPPEAEYYAAWLCSALERPLSRVLYQVGGTAAVSAAIALAQRCRAGRVLAVAGGFHGLALDALAASDISKTQVIQHTRIGNAVQGTYQLLEKGAPAPNWEDISCLLFEPVQGASGMLPLDPEWIRSLCDEAKRHGVIVIADEVQCGYFRCGHLSYSVQMGIAADIILFGKSMTNGLFPFAALLYDPSLERGVDARSGCFSHTYQPSALGCFAAYSVAKYVDFIDLKGQISHVQLALGKFAAQLESEGLVCDSHVLGPSASMRYVGGDAGRIARYCFDRGVLMALGGWDNARFRLMPPITVEPRNLNSALTILHEGIELDAKRCAH